MITVNFATMRVRESRICILAEEELDPNKRAHIIIIDSSSKRIGSAWRSLRGGG